MCHASPHRLTSTPLAGSTRKVGVWRAATRAAVPCLVLALSSGAASAQDVWRAADLSVRSLACLGHLPDRGQTLLFGGNTTNTESWAWADGNWTELLPPTRPAVMPG